MLKRLPSWLAILALASCATAQAPRGPVTSAEVGLRLYATRDERWQVLRPGAVVYHGEAVILQVLTGQPLHVYAVRLDGSGPSAPLALTPLDAGIIVTPSSPVYLPPGGERYLMGSKPGDEDLRVLASRRPLPAEEVNARLLAAPSQRTRDPPPILHEKDRDPITLRGRLDAAGVALLRCRLRHADNRRDDAQPAAADGAMPPAPVAGR